MALFSWGHHPPRPRPTPPPVPPAPTPTDPNLPPVIPGTGGLQLPCSDTSTRPVATGAAANFLPDGRGPFTFPAPYNTIGVRLTDGSDGDVLPVGYAYWRRINRHEGQGTLRVLASRQDGPALLLTVDKVTLQVERHELADVWGTGEMWYWDAFDPDVFYLMDGPTLVAYDVIARSRRVVFNVGEGLNLWQPHSSADGRTHSGTVEDAGYHAIHAAVGSGNGLRVIPVDVSRYDECQIDKTGRYLLVKLAADNVVYDLDRGTETLLLDAEGAVGHSDNGPGYVVGENDHHAQPGAFEKRDLGNIRGDPTLVYYTTNWQAMARHVAIAWDRPTPIGVFSSACPVNVPRSNELVVAPLDGSQVCTVVAPAMCLMSAVDDYVHEPKANVDPIGEWACWSANPFGGRIDLFLVRLP